MNGNPICGQGASEIHIGIDVGSTTTKAVAIDARTKSVLYAEYRRHHAHQVESLKPILSEILTRFPDSSARVAMSGSGGKAIAEYLGIEYIQEVVANSIALQELHPDVRCAIELGGQDAKMLFFEPDSQTGRLNVSDMRMNGSCAGGTGAFIDEIASLLKTPVEQLNALAEAGETVHSISGRCGVYAKTDIQPLLNQGARKEDIALSTFHAIAKQTLGGLAQGLDIHPPVVFEGGPLTFNPELVRVFAQRLRLADCDVIVPKNPEVIVAQGAALSVSGMLSETAHAVDLLDVAVKLENANSALIEESSADAPFFETEEERHAFLARHTQNPDPRYQPERGQVVDAYLGIDSGSTTTKFVLIDEDEQVIDAFYASNEGEPLDIAQKALLQMADRYRKAGAQLNILGCGTTGYGELMFSRAFHADFHVVETVAHSCAAAKYVPDVSFILDIGGQDMKAIWVDDGIVTDILVNEACSSGCGSFLENFASSLNIPTDEIASAAFRAKTPAHLGSRCTVFMNSSVVTEQKNGKTPDDIMAGLCRSIIENVFTKVIRISNADVLGDHIVVQGGTFKNDAVLAAFEQYVERPVTRAPYPGLMGAIGVALLTKAHMHERASASCVSSCSSAATCKRFGSSFIGIEALEDFRYTQTTNMTCPFCANACNRTLLEFSDGTQWVTGNRCERGEVVGDPRDEAVREQVRERMQSKAAVPNLFLDRERLLFKDYSCEQVLPSNGQVIGLPRVLSFWDTMPFWTTFWRSLGFTVKISNPSSRTMYESGLSAVASDTVCFPAKLVHGHIRDLVASKVDRIFMPIITTIPSENTESTSESMCAVVKGYPMVIRNSDNPEKRFGVQFDDPLFHWYTDEDRLHQLGDYMYDVFDIAPNATRRAIALADAAQNSFRTALRDRADQVLDDVEKKGGYALVLAARPYHNDPLVNHDLPSMFTELGIPVLTPDSLSQANDVDLSKSRLDIVNNYHARMLSSAILAAEDDRLEYAQLVSFGCGHDAYLSDEIVRLMKLAGDKTPLVLKLDESDVAGPLRIRVRSFVETVSMRRAAEAASAHALRTPEGLSDPYPLKFTKKDRKQRIILMPNTSHAFSRLMAAVFAKEGIRTVALPIGREEAIRLGKKYVHNDICFPAQIVIGEALAELETGKYDDCEVAIGMGKYVGDCRLTHYTALLRKALDDAGYSQVPIVTNDDIDSHDVHPGFHMGLTSALCIGRVLPLIDALEDLLRKMRPYELVPGSANEAFERALDKVIEGVEKGGARGAERGFVDAISIMGEVEYDRSHLKPRVLIVGEYLLNFHPGANHDIEDYLERNGFEVVEARMTDVIRKTYFYKRAQIKEYRIAKSMSQRVFLEIAHSVFNHAHDVCDRIAAVHPLYEPPCRMPDLVKASDPIIHHTFDAGEGVLIPAEILHHAKKGCEAFVILQPFGCLPNHVVGRGIAKRLKEMCPDAQILPLDYDPDVSFANLENRLQMLVMNARAKEFEQSRAAAVEVFSGVGEREYQEVFSQDLAACSARLAAIARDLNALASGVLADERWSKGSLWAGAESEQIKRSLASLQRRASELAVHTDAMVQRSRLRCDKAATAASLHREEIAIQAGKLMAQANYELSRCAEGFATRMHLAARMNKPASKQFNETTRQLVEDTRRQADRFAKLAETWAHQARQMVDPS